MKYKKMAYLLLIIVVITILMVLWQNISEGNINEDKEKGNSEVKFLEGKIEKIFNNRPTIVVNILLVIISIITLTDFILSSIKYLQ